MQRNTELLEKTMQHILDHPEQHDQRRVWNECGTPGCFIGWAMHFDGVTLAKIDEQEFDTVQWGCDNLGLTASEFYQIFYPGNTIGVLQLMVKDLVNGDELKSPMEYQEMVQG